MLGIIGATDKGLTRVVNEDRFAGEVFAPDFAYGVVCDGMGGQNGGGIASGIACEEIRRMVENSHRGMDERSVYLLLETAISTANIMVYEKAVQQPGDESLRGMGTTACLAVVNGDTAFIANVGDSRAYLVREDALTQLTTDHTVVQRMVDRGEITPEEAATHQNRNLITRAVGVERTVDISYSTARMEAGDILLLCSDGLYSMIPAELLPGLLQRCVAEDDGRLLLEEANRRGGRDNITAVIIYK